jgi:L-fucose mutarotase
MLKGIHPLLSADLLHVLARMGHGDDIAIVDANHPAEAVASATTSGVLIRCPGVAVDAMLAAVLTVLPVDSFTDDPIRFMQVVGDAATVPEAVADMRRQAVRAGFEDAFATLERFAFYDAAKRAFAVVQCGDARFYGNVLVRKGAIEGGRPAG